ncbi:MAG: HAMP domain-containing protein, partial [Bacteroidota bacterium]|nr:HAMP domain-containing protein [Bacteroidota bacterium]
MKIKMTIKSKMLLYILVVSSLIYAAALGYVSFKLDKITFSDAQKIADSYAGEYANITKADLNIDIDMARATAQAMQDYKKIDRKDRKRIYTGIIKNQIKENSNFLSTWITWDMDLLYPEWNKPFGRERLTYYQIGGQIKFKQEIVDTLRGTNKGAYYDIKKSKDELVMNPYFFTYKEGEDEILETSVGAPIIVNSKFIGLVGYDIGMARFQNLINTIHPLEDSYGFLVSNNASIVAHPNSDLSGKSITELDYTDNQIEKISSGKKFSYFTKDKNNREFYISHYPITIGKSTTPWSFAFAVPVDVIMAEAKATLKRTILVGFVGLVILSLVIIIIAITISRPIVKTTKLLGDLADGDIDKSKKLNINTGDEIGEMSNSVNTLIDGLNKTAEFANEIGKGNLDAQFDLLSDKDVLGKSLIEMRNSLRNAKTQENQRKLEDEKQNWATHGVAKFGDILRQNNDDMAEFAYHIISNLVKYI